MKWTYIAALLLACLACGCATPPSSLPAPQQGAPRDGLVFNTYPRETTLTWLPVEGASRYGLMVDLAHGSRWASDVRSKYFLRKTDLAAPVHIFTFPGAMRGRWRVWAYDRQGRAGAKSLWRVFEYKK